MLRGAGVALTLPWLASLAPRAAKAEVAPYPKRFLPIFFPEGAAEFWRPSAVGSGDAWSLSPILQPFAGLKRKMNVLSNVENVSSFYKTTGDVVDPSHSRTAGGFLTCVDADVVAAELKLQIANGISVDQVVAQHPKYDRLTKLPSMQVGIATEEGYCDGRDCSRSRSISWKSPTEPLYKDVDPGTIFDKILGITGYRGADYALDKSVLDAVYDSASSTRSKLGGHDQKKLDEFLDSVRSLEQRTRDLGCVTGKRPTLIANGRDFPSETAAYSKDAHASIMNDLIVMAFQCDVTRVISYMMGNSYCEYVYSFLVKRHFAAAGSTPGTNPLDVCGNYEGAMHAGSANDGYATINWWQSTKVAQLCARLDAIEEGDGVSVLDNSLVMFASCLHGGNNSSFDLPVALIGGAGGAFKTDQHLKLADYPGRPLRDLYLTILNGYFGLGVPSFGQSALGAPNVPIAQLLAT